MTVFDVYLLLTVTDFRNLFFVVTVVLAGVVFLMTVFHHEERGKFPPPYFKTFITLIVVFSTLIVLIPSKSDMLTLIAWHFAQNTDGFDKLPAELVEYIRRFIKDATP